MIKFTSLIIAGLITVLATGGLVSVSPDSATNPVGTTHTVVATLREPPDEKTLCEIYDKAIEEIWEQYGDEIGEEEPPTCDQVDLPTIPPFPEDIVILFQVTDGPNLGKNSYIDGGCAPSCTDPDVERVTWTYRSNGKPGTDTILVCANTAQVMSGMTQQEATTAQVDEDEIEAIFLDALNEVLGTNYRSLEDGVCQTVQKTWVNPNVGGALSSLFQGQPTPLPTAAAPAPAAPGPVIRPPNTGDAGLK